LKCQIDTQSERVPRTTNVRSNHFTRFLEEKLFLAFNENISCTLQQPHLRRRTFCPIACVGDSQPQRRNERTFGFMSLNYLMPFPVVVQNSQTIEQSLACSSADIKTRTIFFFFLYELQCVSL